MIRHHLCRGQQELAVGNLRCGLTLGYTSRSRNKESHRHLGFIEPIEKYHAGKPEIVPGQKSAWET